MNLVWYIRFVVLSFPLQLTDRLEVERGVKKLSDRVCNDFM